MFKKAKSLFFKSDKQSVDIANYRGEFSGGLQYSGNIFVNEASSLRLSAVWACVNLYANTQSYLPFSMYQKKSGDKEPVEDHPLVRLLRKSPNFYQTAADFWGAAAFALELRGNFYAEIIRSGGRVVSLMPIDGNVSVQRNQTTGALEYRWSDGGRYRVDPPENIFHIRGAGGGVLGGISTLAAARSVFGSALSIEQSSEKTFANGLQPSGILKFDQFLSPENRKLAQEKLVSQFAGTANAGKPIVLEGGASWQQLAITPDDAQMIESRNFSVEEICRIFGVPPALVGHSGGLPTIKSIEELMLLFLQTSLLGRINRIEQAIEKQLLTPAEQGRGLSASFSLDSLLRADTAARGEFYAKMVGSGLYTANEVRSKEKLPPHDGGDILRTQMQNIPLGQAVTNGASNAKSSI